MASVNWKKNKGNEAFVMLRHASRYDDDDDTVSRTYKNRFIDPSRTHLNTRISHSNKYETGRETYERLKNRVKEIDAVEPPKLVRKDRVTAISFTVTTPENLPPEQEEQFFSIVYDHLTELAGGAENISPLYIHRDETHPYIDVNNTGRDSDRTGTIVMSRVHAHCTAVPYVAGRGVNAKNFMTRASMRELNQRIDATCREQLGVPFLTDARQATGRSVEELQDASEKALRQQELDSINAKIEEAKESLLKTQQQLDSAKSEAESAVRQAKIEKEKASSASAKKAKLDVQIHAARQAKAKAEKEADSAKARAQEMRKTAEEMKQRAEEMKTRYRNLAKKYNSLTHRFNGLARQATVLGIAVAKKVKEIQQEQYR